MADKKRTLWIEANDPNTPQERLAKIAACKKPEFLIALVKNPNTPRKDLLRLMHRDPIGFINNPATPLHLLESPDLLSGVQLQGLRALANLPEPPDWILSAFALVPAPLKITLLSEERLNPKLLFIFAQDSDLNLRGMLTRHNRATAEVLALLLPRATPEHKAHIASHPSVSSETLAALASEPDANIRVAVARNRKTSAALLGELSKDANQLVREAAVQNVGSGLSLNK